jgi:hypothetical protein
MIELARRYRYVIQDSDRHGNVRTYLRLPGKPKVRLRETPGTDAFEAEYRRALDAKPAPKKLVAGAVLPASVDALCIAYFMSGAFRKMDTRSQHVRRLILDKFRTTYGNRPVAKLEARHLIQIRDADPDQGRPRRRARGRQQPPEGAEGHVQERAGRWPGDGEPSPGGALPGAEPVLGSKHTKGLLPERLRMHYDLRSISENSSGRPSDARPGEAPG